MRGLATFEKVFLHRTPVDGRKQINGLSALVEAEMGEDPFGSGLFVFINKRRDSVRLLYWDKSGFALWTKRLERETFRWPLRLQDSVVTLSVRELMWLLDGLDILALRPHETLSFAAVR